MKFGQLLVGLPSVLVTEGNYYFGSSAAYSIADLLLPLQYSTEPQTEMGRLRRQRPPGLIPDAHVLRSTSGW